MQNELTNLIGKVRSAWRFRWWALLAAWVVCLSGWAWAFSLPDVYEARARVLVDTTSILRRILGRQILPEDLNSQLTYVRQALAGRSQLTEVARTTDLYLRATTTAEFESLISGLRSRIRITGAGSRGRNMPNNMYTITYNDTDRDMAISVVATLLNVMVESTLRKRRKESESARQFLSEQINEYSDRLTEAETRLASFKKSNAGRLPDSRGGQNDRLQSELIALDEASKQLRLAHSKREQIESQLQNSGGLDAMDSMTLGAIRGTDDDMRIRAGEANLQQLLLRYTEKHPDVVALREQLAELKAIQAGAIPSGGVGIDGNPVYQALQMALHEVEVELAILQADVDERISHIADLRSKIDEIMEVEVQFKRLNRDYDIIYAQYDRLVQGLETETLSTAAQVSEQLEFDVIDPPAAEFSPILPNRLRLYSLILIAGFAAAGALALILSRVQPIFENAQDLREVTGFPILGTISLTFTDQHRFRRRLQAAYLAFGIVLLVTTFGFLCIAEVTGIDIPVLSG